MSGDGRGLAHFAEIRRRDGDKIARGVFQQLDSLGPVHVPPPFVYSSNDVRKAFEEWRSGAPLKDEHVEEFARWLEHTRTRSSRIGENERRLQTTIWAQERLCGEGDYYARFADFHLDAWGVEHWSEDPKERADQIKAAARRGMPSVKPQRRDVRHG